MRVTNYDAHIGNVPRFQCCMEVIEGSFLIWPQLCIFGFCRIGYFYARCASGATVLPIKLRVYVRCLISPNFYGRVLPYCLHVL